MKSSRLIHWTAVIAMAVISAACSSGEARKASYLERAQKYFAEQNYDKARIEVRNALQIDPNYLDARFLSGRVAEKKAEIREAAGNYQAALDIDPKYSPARAALARLYLFSGLGDKSLELVEAGLKDDPQNAALLTVRGAVQAQKGHVVAALEDAEAADKISPNDEFTISLLASLYKQSARLDKAIEVVNRGLEHSPKNVDLRVVLADLEASRENFAGVEQQLKQVVSLEPTRLVHYARLAKFYLSRKDLSKAEATWREAIKAIPDSSDPKLALIDLLWAQQGEAAGEKELQSLLANDDDATLKLALAGYLERQSKTEQAEQIYQGLVKESDKEAAGLTARSRLAALYLKRNDVTQAQALIAKVLEENPRDNDALALRANMALRRGDTATAITDLRAVLRDQPNSIPVLRALAQAHLQNHEVALAEETLRGAVQANPGELSTRKELAQLLLQQGKGDQARQVLEPVAGMQGLSDDPEILDAQLKAQLSTKDFAAAQATAEKAQQLRPKAAMGWYYAGLVAEAQKNFDLARQNYEKALELQPQVAEPLTALVRLDVLAKNNQAALARLSKAIESVPKNVVAYNLRGELLMAEKQGPAAIASFEKAIEFAPGWWTPYRGLAMAQISQKQNDAAIASFKRGIESTHAGALYTDLAALHERMGKSDDAIKVYEEWVSREPKSLLAARNLTMLLLNYRSDYASLQRATQVSEALAVSNDPAALEARGWVKYKNGEFQAAVNLLREAAATNKDSAVVRYRLGMAQLRVGDRNSARENLQAALAGGKAFFGIDEARTALDQLKQSG